MHDWQLQAMKENADAAEWERLNPELKEETIGLLVCAIANLQNAYESAISGAAEIEGTPMYDRIISSAHEIEDIGDNLKELKNSIERGDFG